MACTEWHGQLVGVQNLTTPGARDPHHALLRRRDHHLGDETLLSHHHNVLDEPTTGAVNERGFHLLAATGVGHYNEHGTIDDPEGVPKPTILRLLLPR